MIGRWFNTPAVTKAGANASEDEVLLLLPATTTTPLPRRRIDDLLLLPNAAALAPPQRKDVETHSAWTVSFITCICVEREGEIMSADLWVLGRYPLADIMAISPITHHFQ